MDGHIAVSELLNASNIPLSFAITSMQGYTIAVGPCWFCFLASFPGSDGIPLASLVHEPFFLQCTLELSFIPALISSCSLAFP